MIGKGLRGLGALRLEAKGEGGGVDLARTRHYAISFAQLNPGVNKTGEGLLLAIFRDPFRAIKIRP
jgi:hypothetical protein